MTQSCTVESQDGTQWYVEQQGSGPDLVLVPSGEGDCSSYDRIASILSKSFSVTTFDMPGFSRSIAGHGVLDNLKSPRDLSRQVIGVLDALKIETAHFYGCSSGAACVLGLVAVYPSRVLSATIHEIPLGAIDGIDNLVKLDDAGVSQACQKLFAFMAGDNIESWEALGPAYHARLTKNTITWVRKYVGKMQSEILSDEEWKLRPITWTIGADNPAGMFFNNVTTATQQGLPISLLPCRHMPQVTIPEALADHIQKSVLKMSA